MATKAKESAQNAKEKRVTSPSYRRQTDTAQQRTRPNPPPLGLDQKKAEKNVPNYLKPTKSSGLDPTKTQVKKQNPSIDPGNKPSLNRRRSFDKPPSPSQLPKQVSAGERSIRPSLSISSRSGTNSPKAHPDKLLIPPKDAGKHLPSPLHPRPANNVKKEISITMVNVKKPNMISTSSSSTSSAAKQSQGNSSPNLEKFRQEDQESPLTKTEEKEEVEEMVHTEHNNENLDVVSETQILEEYINEDHLVQSEVEEFNDGAAREIKLCESSEDQNEAPPPAVDLEGQKIPISIHIEENNNEEGDEDKNEHQADQVSSFEGGDPNKPKLDVENNVATEKLEEKTVVIEEERETIDHGVGDEGIKEAENIKSKELSLQVEAGNNAKGLKAAQEMITEKSNSGVSSSTTPGKTPKDSSSVAYNDVIEETASKLRGQKKNKVRALVGAFETVISLESED